MKCDSRKGDFHNLVINHLKDLDINMTKTDIRNHKKKTWKLFIAKTMRKHVLTQLVEENSKLEHTKDMIFNELKLRNYLDDNRNHSLSKIIFSVRSSTLNMATMEVF